MNPEVDPKLLTERNGGQIEDSKIRALSLESGEANAYSFTTTFENELAAKGSVLFLSYRQLNFSIDCAKCEMKHSMLGGYYITEEFDPESGTRILLDVLLCKECAQDIAHGFERADLRLKGIDLPW